MFRLGLLATLTALILTGCVSQYSYRNDNGGDYYYAEPSIDDYDIYVAPYGSMGYGYPGGWYGGFTFGFGSRLPYLRYGYPYGYPYGYYGYPYRYPYYYGPRIRRPPPPGGGNNNPPGGNSNPPGGDPTVDTDEDSNSPWRNLDGIRRRRQTPEQPGVTDDAPGMVGRVRHAPVSMPERSSQPRQRMEAPRSQPSMPRRIERPERDSGRELER